MAKYQCNSCEAVYLTPQLDGGHYAHVCAPVVNPNHQPDLRAPKYDPATHVARENARNENPPQGLQYIESKPFMVTRDKNDATRETHVPATSLIVSEGAGRTLLPD